MLLWLLKRSPTIPQFTKILLMMFIYEKNYKISTKKKLYLFFLYGAFFHYQQNSTNTITQQNADIYSKLFYKDVYKNIFYGDLIYI